MKRNLVAIAYGLILLGLTSCAPVYYTPYPKELRRIRNLPYEIGIFDCKHKSIMDKKFLKTKGITSKIVFGRLGGGMHAWEEVYNPETNNWYVRDATVYHTGEGWKISFYTKRQKGKWGEFEEGATVEDIKNYDKIKKIYWKNIPQGWEFFFKLKNKKKSKSQ